MIFVRRAVRWTGLGRIVAQWRRHKIEIPNATPPNPALLRSLREDSALPDDIRDARLLAEAIVWAERRRTLPEQKRAARTPRVSSPHRPIENILFISHGDFPTNSAVHVYKIASELHRRGLSPVIAVPDNVEGVEDLGPPPFLVLTYEDARSGRLRFPDGRGADLVHAFTARELVRKLATEIVQTYESPYVVHLEDNDEVILSAELGGESIERLKSLPAPFLDTIVGPKQLHPLRGPHFLEHAAGVTVVIDRLLELVPPCIPTAVLGAGFDESLLLPTRPRAEVRAELNIRPNDVAIVYTGNIHATNLDEMRTFYRALTALRRDGYPVVLVKTGVDAPEANMPNLGDGIRNLGWVPRGSIPALLAAADVLVQPGTPGPFNDYRSPSKVPDFLASGKPVILSRTNVGRSVRDGYEAIVLANGTADEIYRAIALLHRDREFAASVGEHGRAFALRELQWSKSADNVEQLYREIAANRYSSAKWSLELDPPIKAVAFASERPNARDVRVARAHGIFGFCFPPGAYPTDGGPDFPFCFRIGSGADETISAALEELSNSAYITVHGVPLLLADEPDAAERWRSLAQETTGGPVHFALLDDSGEGREPPPGFDSSVEMPDACTSDAITTMHIRLSRPLPEHVWFRSVAFPDGGASRSVYGIWLRKLVLQALCRASAQEPLIFVDPRAAWTESRTSTVWLRSTRSALRDGIQQFYSSRRLEVSARRIEHELRLE